MASVTVVRKGFFNDAKFRLKPEELDDLSYPNTDIKWAVGAQRSVLAQR